MKKTVWILSTIILIGFIVNCSLEVPEEIVKENIEIMEEEMNDFTVIPFTEYPAYYQAGNNVFGIPVDAKGPGDMVKINPKVEVEGKEIYLPFNQFFAVNGKVYFRMLLQFPPAEEGLEPETIEKFCTLKNGVVEILEIFPGVPESVRVTGTTGIHQIDIGDYKGEPISLLTRYHDEEVDYVETLMFVDGFILINGGLLINVVQGRGSSRPSGLLFWGDNDIDENGDIIRQNRNMDKWKELGRFWK